MRLHKLDSYLRTLRQMQAVPLSEYLSEELEDFYQFSQEITARFLPTDLAST
jgi:hypothetical protein